MISKFLVDLTNHIPIRIGTIKFLTEEKKDLEMKLKQEAARNNETEVYYQEKLQDMTLEHEQAKQKLAEKYNAKVRESEVTVRELTRKAEETKDLFTSQMNNMEHDYKTNLDEKDEQIRKLLQQIREKESLNNKYISECEAIKKNFAAKVQSLEEQKEQLQYAIQDMTTQHNSQINELRQENSKQNIAIKATYEPTLQKLMIDVEECQAVIKTQKENIRIYQRQIDDSEKQRLFDMNSIKSEYEERMRKKEKEVEDIKEKHWENVQKVESKDEMINTFKKLLEDKKKEYDNIHEELKLVSEREIQAKRELLRINLQLEHEQETKIKEDTERHDQLLKLIKRERDEANAMLEDRDRHIEEYKKELAELKDKIMALNTELQISQQMASSGYLKVKQQPIQQTNYQQLINELDDELGLGSLATASTPSSIANSVQINQSKATEPTFEPSKLSPSVDLLTVSNMHIDQITKMNSLMTELRIDLEDQKDKLFKAEDKLLNMATENKILRSKLKEAVKDLRRIYKEKEQLIDISNMLKSELSKAKEALYYAQTAIITTTAKPASPVMLAKENIKESPALGVTGKSKTLTKKKKNI